jgi:hypothetical protein
MKIPGFTAEASLYEPKRHYRMATNGASTTPVRLQAILPQSCRNYPGIGIVCIDIDPLWGGDPSEINQIRNIMKI